MTEALPDPLVPEEVDLRDFQYMELDVQRLRDSRFAAEVDGEAFRAGLLLWCASWHQVPAASLPDNDVELSNLAGFGRVVKEWKKVREQALSLFVRCCDGRLYHPIIAEKALSAWDAKLRHHYDRACDRLRKTNKTRAAENLPPLVQLTFEQWNVHRKSGGTPMEKADASIGIPPEKKKPSDGIPTENALKGNGEGTERETLSVREPTSVGMVGMALKRAGVHPTTLNLSDPVLLALIDQGATPDEFEGIAREAVAKGVSKPQPWICKVLQDRRAQAKNVKLAPKQRASTQHLDNSEQFRSGDPE